MSDNNAASSKDSPASWFHPQMSSTRAVGVSDETSGYKTGAVWPGVDSASAAISTNSNTSANASKAAREAKLPAKKVSSISEEHATSSASVEKSKHQDDLFPSEGVGKKVSNEDEEIEDLFSGSSLPSRVSGKSLWRLADDGDDTDDLFSTMPKSSTLPRKSAPDDGSVRANHSSKGPHLQQKPASSPLSSVVQNRSGSKLESKTGPPDAVKSNILDSVEDVDDLFASESKPSTTQALSKGEQVIPPAAHKNNSPKLKSGDVVVNSSTPPKIAAKTTVAQSDDLFTGPSRVSGWKPSSLFEDDDDSLFDSGRNKLPDSVSVSSSRSSLFDEPNIGKSTLPSIFENKTSQLKSEMKVSLFEDVEDELDLFAKNSTPPKEEKMEPASNSKSGGSTSVTSVPKTELAATPVPEEVKGTVISSTRELMEPKPSLGVKKPLEDDENDLFGAVGQKIKSLVPGKIEATVEPSTGQPELVKTKPTPPSSLSIRKTNDIMAGKDEADGEVIKVAVSKKIGKINIPSSLKINPVALLPGAKLVKQTPRLENEDSRVPAEKDSAAASDECTTLGAASPPDISPAVSVGSSASGASAGEPNSVTGQTLSSTVRGRARIPVKRRPQTRKARHEALRVSGIDFGTAEPLSPGPSGSDRESTSSLFHTAENTPSPAFISPSPSNPLSPSTDEEDYFNVPELDSNFEKEDQSIFKRDSLHSSTTGVESDETLLFDGAPVISPIQAKPETPTVTKNFPEKSFTSEPLFAPKSEKIERSLLEDKNTAQPTDKTIISDEDDLFSSVKSSRGVTQKIDDDDLFGPSSSPLPPRKSDSVSLFSDNKTPLVPSKQSKSLLAKTTASVFEDSDDDDDIFSGNISAPPTLKSSQTPAVIAPVPKTRVETAKEPFVDPLGLLLDGND